MGCHTWFYRKIERTQKEANDACIEGIKKSRKLAWKIYKNPTTYRNINWLEDLYDNDLKKCLNTQKEIINTSNRKIKAIYNGYYQKAVWNHQNDKELTEYIDGQGLYIEDTGFHDVFRKYGYPDDRLFSLEETLNYINNYENKCIVYENTIDLLKDFWSKYPDGFIEFG